MQSLDIILFTPTLLSPFFSVYINVLFSINLFPKKGKNKTKEKKKKKNLFPCHVVKPLFSAVVLFSLTCLNLHTSDEFHI